MDLGTRWRHARAWTPFLLAGLGAPLGAAAVVLKARDGSHPVADTVLTGIAGLLFLAAGTVAHALRPGNRVGLLMVVVGVAWFAEDLRFAPVAAVFTIGLVCAHASSAAVAHLVLAFPTGRLDGRPARMLVAAVYVAAFGVAGLGLLVFDPARHGLRYPDNLLLVHPAPHLVDLVGHVVEVAGGAVAAAVAVLLLRRWRRAGRPLRRLLAPVFLTGLVGAVASLSSGVAGRDSAAGAAALVLYNVAFCLLPLGFLAGALRVRLGRAGVGGLLAELRQPVPPERLRDLLARALGDPSLRIGYWRPERDGYVDAAGDPVPLPDARSHQCATPIDDGGAPVAVLLHDRALREDRHRLDAVVTAAGLALGRERLRESRARIVAAMDAERRRVERDLHDGAQQRLVTVALSLREAIRRLDANPDPAVADLLDHSARGLDSAVDELRDLARGILPAVLTDAGIGAALAALARRTPLPVRLAVAPVPRLAAPVEATVYFVAAEALTNVVKHAEASYARLAVDHDGATLRLEVADDGAGGAAIGSAGGLAGLRERVAALGGSLVVRGVAGAGTVVSVTIPCGHTTGGGR